MFQFPIPVAIQKVNIGYRFPYCDVIQKFTFPAFVSSVRKPCGCMIKTLETHQIIQETANKNIEALIAPRMITFYIKIRYCWNAKSLQINFHYKPRARNEHILRKRLGKTKTCCALVFGVTDIIFCLIYAAFLPPSHVRPYLVTTTVAMQWRVKQNISSLLSCFSLTHTRKPLRHKRYAVFTSHYLARKNRICVREKFRIIYNLILDQFGLDKIRGSKGKALRCF